MRSIGPKGCCHGWRQQKPRRSGVFQVHDATGSVAHLLLQVLPALLRIDGALGGQARFEAILAVALELIAARGYEAVSMREIAREAGLPIASLYLYFPTKLAIVQEVLTSRGLRTSASPEGNLLIAELVDTAFIVFRKSVRTSCRRMPAFCRDGWYHTS